MSNIYQGVSFQKSKNRYSSRYTYNNHRYFLGLFVTIEEAYCVREAFEYAIAFGEIQTDELKVKISHTKLLKQKINNATLQLQILYNSISDERIRKELLLIIKQL